MLSGLASLPVINPFSHDVCVDFFTQKTKLTTANWCGLQKQSQQTWFKFSTVSQFVRCNNAIIIKAFCTFVHFLSGYCWRYNHLSLAGNFASKCYYVHVQSALMVNVVNWSNKSVCAILTEKAELSCSQAVPTVPTCTRAQCLLASDANKKLHSVAKQRNLCIWPFLFCMYK